MDSWSRRRKALKCVPGPLGHGPLEEPPLCCGRLIFTVHLSCLVLQLFLDDAKVKNFITCFKGNAFPSPHTGPLRHMPGSALPCHLSNEGMISLPPSVNLALAS